MKGDRFGGDVDADVVFCAGFFRVPGDERCAGLFVELVFLMRGPIRRHKDLQTGDEIAEAGGAPAKLVVRASKAFLRDWQNSSQPLVALWLTPSGADCAGFAGVRESGVWCRR